jgi:predicted NBD/HSP70 family sugar kinase
LIIAPFKGSYKKEARSIGFFFCFRRSLLFVSFDNIILKMSKASPFSDKNQTILGSVLDFVIQKGNTSRREIQSGTGLAWNAVSNAVASLMEHDFLTEGKILPSDGAGRKASSLLANVNRFALVGVDINGSCLSGVLLSLDKKILYKAKAPFPQEGKNAILEGIFSFISSLEEEAGKKAIELLGIGLSMQGKVDSENGISQFFSGCPREEWSDVPLAYLVGKRFSLPCFLEHDPNCLLYGESVKKGLLPNVIMLRLDYGIGMAVRMDGKILQGINRFDIGHACVVPNGLRCYCGRRGCLDAYISLSSLAHRSGVSPDEFFAHAENYPDLFKEVAEYLSVSLYNAAILFQPDQILFAGRLLEKKALFLDQTLLNLEKDLDGKPPYPLLYTYSDEEDGAYGAACIAYDHIVLQLDL